MSNLYKYLLLLAFLIGNNPTKSQSTFTGIVKYKREYSNPNIPGDSMKIIFDKHRVSVSFYSFDSALNDTRESAHIWNFKTQLLYSIDKHKRTYSVGPYGFGNPFVFKKHSANCIFDTLHCSRYVDKRKALKNSSFKEIECEVSNNHQNLAVKDLVFVSVQPLIIQSKIVLEIRTTMEDGQVTRTYATEIIPIKNVAAYFSLQNLKKTEL